MERDYTASLARLSSESSAGDFNEGPVEYVDIDLANNQSIACVKQGVYLFAEKGEPMVMLLGRETDSYPPKILVEVMARK